MSESKGGPAKGEAKKSGALRMAADAGARMRALMGSPAPEEAAELESGGVGELESAGAEESRSGGVEESSGGEDVRTDERTDVLSNVATDVHSYGRTNVSTEDRPDVRTLQDYTTGAGSAISVSEPIVAPLRATEDGGPALPETRAAATVLEKPEKPAPARARRTTGASVGRGSTEPDIGLPRTDERTKLRSNQRADVSTTVRSDVGTDVRTLQGVRGEEFERRMAAADERWKDQEITVVAVRVPAALNTYMDRYVSRINECDPKRRYRKQDAVFEAFAAFFASHPMPPAPEDEFG